MSAEDKSETLSIVSSNRSTINISSDSTERMETPPIATSPPVTVTTNGIENKGFIEDEKKNVEFEAVNLELVDLNKSSSPLSEPRVYAPPPQTQPTVTQKFSDYYVSVNEHKKGLRGEKLYVTKDSRRGRGCKRYCCALLVLLVIAATVTIASLVGTGIIDTQPKFKGEINKSGRSRDLPPTNDSLISEPRPVIDNDFGDVNIEANEILPRDAVPNVLEGQMAIKNVAWDDRLSNSSNPFFKDMAQKVEKTLYPIFVSPMKEERADFFITVKEFERKDGVTPHYRVGWELKDNSFSDGLELITKDEISEMMMKHLKSNNGRLNNVFDVPMESIRVKRVADDKCDIMQCQSFCSYDYPSNDFKCGCSQSFMLAEDGRTCIEDSTDPTSNVNLLTAFGLPSDAENDQQGSFEVDTTVSTLETTKDETVSRLETTEDESVSQKSNIDIESDDYAKVPRFLNTSVDHDNGHGDHSAFEDEHHQLDDEWGNTEFPILDSFGEMVTINDSDLKNTSDHNNHENSQYDKNGSLQSHLEKGAHGKEHNGEIIHHNQEHEHGNIDQTWQSTQSNTEGNSGVVDQGLESLEENWNITSGAEPNNLINHNLHDPALDKLNTNGQNNQGNEQHENGFDPVFHGSNANEQNNPVNEHHSDGVDHSLLVGNTNGQKNKENEEHSIGIDHTLNVSNTNTKNNEDKEEHKDGFDPTLQGSTSNGQNTTGDEQHENVFEPTLLGSNDNGLNNQGNEQPSDGVQPILQVSNTNTQNNEDNEGHKNGFEPALQGSDSNIQNTQGDEQHGNVFEPTLDGSNANDQNNPGDEQHINGVDHNLHSSNSNVDNIQGHDGHNNGVDPSLNGSNSNVQGNVGNENGFEPALNGSNSNDQNNQVLDKQVSVSFSSENESSKENQNENNNSVSLSQNTDDFEQSRISSDENTGHLEKEHEHDEVPKFSFSSRMNDSKEEESDQKSHHVSGVNHNKKHRNDHAEGLSSNEGGNLGINGSYEESADAESNNNSNEFNLNTEESNTYPDDKEGINQLSGSSQSLEDDVNSEQNTESSSSEPEDNLEDQINNLNNLKKSSNINGKSTILKEGNDKVNVVSSNPETNSNKDDREHPTTSENDSNSKEQIDTLVTAGTVDNLNKKSNTADNSGESSDTNEETDEANIQILGLASPLGKDLDEKEKNGKEFIQKQNETNINIVEKEDSRKITILEKSEDEIAHEDPKKVEHGSIHHISEKTENVNIHQGSEKKPNEKQSITFVHSAGNDQSVTDSSPFENNQSTKESSIEGHYHGDVFHAGFHEDDSFVDSDSRDHQFQSSTTDESNREDKVITEIFDSENSGLNDNGESNSSIDNDNGESNSSIDDKISSPTLQTLNVEDDATTSKTSSLNSTPAKRNSTLEGIDSKNVDTKEVLSDGITTQSTSFITDYSETQDVSPTETNVNEQTTEFAFENKINEGIGVTVSPNSKNDKVFEKKNVNEPENPNARTILESKDNLGREALDNKSQSNSNPNESTNIVIPSGSSIDTETEERDSINDFDATAKNKIIIQDQNDKIESNERDNNDTSGNTILVDDKLVTASSAVKQSPEKINVITSQDQQIQNISKNVEPNMQDADDSTLLEKSTERNPESNINNDAIFEKDTESIQTNSNSENNGTVLETNVHNNGNLDHGISQSDFVEDEGDKGPNIEFNTSDQNISTQQSIDSDIINTFEGHNEKGDIIQKDEDGSLETDQSTEKIRDDIFNDILHKFASGVTNINIQPETKYNEKNKSNENKLDNSKNISQINEHIETIFEGTSGSTNEQTTTANPRNFDASDIVNKVGNIVIKSDNDKNETKFRISGSLGNENSLPNNETFNFEEDISQENINSSNVFHVKDQNIFTNDSQLDPELIQKIILRNVLNNNQTNPFHQDSQPYQFGLQYPNGTEAVFNFNGTTLDSSLIPTFILSNSTHENIKENIAILPNGQPIPNHQQQFQSASDEIVDEKEVPSSSPGSNQVIFGEFQLPKGTPVNVTSDLSTSFLSEFNPQIELNSKNDETSNPNISDNPNQVIFGGFHLPNGTKIDLTSNIPNQQQHNLEGFFINNGSYQPNLSEIINTRDISQLLVNSASNGNSSSIGYNFPDEKDVTKLVLKQLLNNSSVTDEANNRTGIENILIQNIFNSIKENLNSKESSLQNLDDFFNGSISDSTILNNLRNNSDLAQILLQTALHPNNGTGDGSPFGINFPNQTKIAKLVLQQLFNKSNGTVGAINGTGIENTLVQSVLDSIVGNNNRNASFNLNFLSSNTTDVQKLILSNLLQNNGAHNLTSVFSTPSEEDVRKALLNKMLQQNKNNSSTGFPSQNGNEIQQEILSSILSPDGNKSLPLSFLNSNETNVKKLILQNLLPTSDSERDQELNIFKEIVLGQDETTTEKDMGNITEILKKNPVDFKSLSGADFSSHILGRMQKSSRKINYIFGEGCKDPQNEFQCIGHGDCLPKQLRCNGIYDCRDGSDELLCDKEGFEKETCQELQCPNGPCIPSDWKCDGKIDCPESYDELDCHSTSLNCTDNEFYCVKDARCIASSFRCDGTSDCVREDEDERNCNCDLESQFKCIIGGGCIDFEKVCDGVEDCPDLSDEFNCLKATTNGEIQIRNNNDTWSTICFNKDSSLEFAKASCQQLGYASAKFESTTLENKESSNYKGFSSNVSLTDIKKIDAKILDDIPACDSNPKTICEEFECSKRTLTERQIKELKAQGTINITSLTSENELWPSLAYLFNVKRKTSCVVTILNPKWLITSHGCMAERSMDPLEWVAFAGPANGQTDQSKTQIKIVKRIVSNPSVRFQQGYYTDDLALIELNDPLIFNDHVQATCLEESTLEDNICFVAGWADVNKEGVSFIQYLDRIPLPMMSQEECNSQSHYNKLLNGNSLCTSSKHQNIPCRMDSGAPLLCYQGDRWRLRGILSREGECLPSTLPDIFTSVDSWKSWISNVIGENES